MLVKYLFVAAAAVVGTVAAAKCDAQAQFDLCKQNMQTNVDACAPNDAHCLCKAHKIIRDNCYPLCPQDLGKGAQDNQIASWCISAGGEKEPSSSAPVAVATTTTASTGSSTDTSAPSETTSTSTSTDSPSGDDDETTETTTSGSPEPTGNSGNMLAPAGFMVAAAAVAGLVL